MRLSLNSVLFPTMKNKLLNEFIIRPSNFIKPYQGATGEMIPCVVSDQAGHYIAPMDIPAVIWDSLPDAE